MVSFSAEATLDEDTAGGHGSGCGICISQPRGCLGQGVSGQNARVLVFDRGSLLIQRWLLCAGPSRGERDKAVLLSLFEKTQKTQLF